MIRDNFDQGGRISSCISMELGPNVQKTHLAKGKAKRITPQTSNCFVFSERLNVNFLSINVELESTWYKWCEPDQSA